MSIWILSIMKDGVYMQIKGLNIVRTLGVVLVLLYHFFPASLKGGFFGVDVFFTVSGYLITALLVQDITDKKAIQLPAFYKRRLRRLFPPVLLMLIIVIPFTLLISPDFRVGMYKQSAAALAFVTNYYEISIGQSYENQLLPRLFVHTWSLAVEMQFYLLWGALVSITFSFFKRMKQKIALIKTLLLAVTAVLAVVSYINMQLWIKDTYDMSTAYYAASSRFYPFMIGSATGLIFGFSLPDKIKKLISSKALALVSCFLGGISIIGVTACSYFLSFSDEAAYQFGFLAVSLMSSVLITSIRLLHERGWIKEPGFFNFIGTRSYGIYLFHWPVYIIISQLAGMDQSILSAVVSLIITLILAQISYHLIEQRFRIHRFDAPKNRSISRYERGAVVTLSMILLAVSLFTLKTAPLKTSIEENLEYEYRMLTEGSSGYNDTKNE